MKSTGKKLRIGFVGVGGIADLQLKILRQREDVDIVSFADVSPAVLERRSEAFPDVAGYHDFQDMLANEKLQAVSVCTPNGHHAEPTLAALKSGAHVLVEKPMAMTLAEAKRMVLAAQKARRKLVVGFQYRYDPRTQFLRKAMDEGQFGRILYGRVQAIRRRGIPNWGVFGRKDLQGGGPLIDIGIHMLEACHYTMGSPVPVSASADMFTYLGNQPSNVASMWPNWDHETYTVEDLAVGRIRFADGAVLHLETAFAAHVPDQSLMNFQLMGEAGGAVWDPAAIYRDEAGHMVNKTPGWLADTSFDKTFARKMHAFVDHVLYRKAVLAPAREGLLVQAMLNALYQSAERGGRGVRIRL